MLRVVYVTKAAPADPASDVTAAIAAASRDLRADLTCGIAYHD